ncbi:MAG: J domain-containing protein [Betaproteobacteria bacterium]|nr:J domain-containing protein [Betaproteobacteria bacterium]
MKNTARDYGGLSEKLGANYYPEGRLVPGSVSGRVDGRQFKIDFDGGKNRHTRIVLSHRNIRVPLPRSGELSDREFADLVLSVVESNRSEGAHLARVGRLLTSGRFDFETDSVRWRESKFLAKADELEGMLTILSLVTTDLERLQAGEALCPSLYEIIGVSPSASTETIKQACLRLGEETRPDKNFGSKCAASRFGQIERAYATLGDPRKRAAYDKGYPPPFDEPWAILWVRVARVFAGISMIVTGLPFVELFWEGLKEGLKQPAVVVLIFAAISVLPAAWSMRSRFDGSFRRHVVLQVLSAPINVVVLYALVQHGAPVMAANLLGVLWAAWLLSVYFLSDGYLTESSVRRAAT